MTFSEISKQLRKEKGLSQIQLATALNISKACISMIEIGKNEPTANTLIKYANFFECSTDYLLGREDDFGNITIKSENPAPALTDEERRWLEKYRKLDYGNKLSVNGYIDAQLDYQEKHKSWKL